MDSKIFPEHRKKARPVEVSADHGIKTTHRGSEVKAWHGRARARVDERYRSVIALCGGVDAGAQVQNGTTKIPTDATTARHAPPIS